MSSLRLRPATSTERQLALLWAAAAASTVALRPLWITLAPFLRTCIFRRLTGVPCPTCGTTRAALALLDLDLHSAFVVNPLAAAAGVAFIIGGFLALVWWLARAPLSAAQYRWSRRWSAAVIAVVVANWVYLIASR